MGAIAESQSTASVPMYSREQLTKYVAFINPDPSYSLQTLEAEIQRDPLATLSLLQLRQNSATVWGNVALHYSSHRSLSLDPDVLFHKIVERKHGGYCMENNAFFSTVLRSLGYKLYVPGARISNALSGGPDPDGFAGWQHEVIIVAINGQDYLVDVGFGSGSPVSAIPLTEDGEREREAVPGSFVRLVHRKIAASTTDQKLWVLELKNTTKNSWSGAYCFTELEWMPQDFEIINYRTSQDPKSWFTYRFVLVKTLMDDETRTKATGTIILMDNKIERRIGGGDKEVLLEAKDEEERIQALRKWFGVELLPEEQRGIRALVSEIRGPSRV